MARSRCRPHPRCGPWRTLAIHTEALRPGTRGAAGGVLSPEEIVQRMRDEVLADAPAARSFSDSVIDLSSMETVPAEHLPTGGDRADDDPAQRVESLRVGDPAAHLPARPL